VPTLLSFKLATIMSSVSIASSGSEMKENSWGILINAV
jgi:hypothetical protein